MAFVALNLKSHHHKTLLRISPKFTLSHHFSSSSDNNDENASKTSAFSYLNDIKSQLKEQEQQEQPNNQRFSFQSPSNSLKVESHEIIKNLLQSHRRSSVPAPALSSPVYSEQPTLLEDLYKRNLAMSSPNPNPNPNPSYAPSFDAIRKGLRNLNTSGDDKGKTGTRSDHFLLSRYKDSFKLGKLAPSMAESGRKIYGGSSDGLPTSVFGRELSQRENMKGEEGKENAEDEMEKSELIRMYTHDELGVKLRDLRPESTKREKGQKEGWFSLTELNERLKKLRDIEKKQPVAATGLSVRVLRRSLKHIELSNAANTKKQEFAKYDILGQLGGTPSFMLSPSKEHLVEKYFHPDNMSSEEKLKLELKRVRDEFKMHNSDCGSTRVQVAQLTTEISHLSSVLHKKDKHSQRGLLAKVQQRKKLLKYLRRTDWDSYSLVLSKFGLRDNPDYKN